VGSEQWTKLGGSTLPNVIVSDIDINYTENALVAATFGRGLWQINISDIVGVEELEFPKSERPNIYPNPTTNGQIHIKFPKSNSQGYYSYHIYNVVGGVIKEGKLTEHDNMINLSSIPKGAYVIKIFSSDNKFISEKIINK
jgi:hypothetical protein